MIKVDAAGNGSTIWTSDQPEIFAVALDRAGVVYAGTSPDGKVYRIENGRATEYFAPGERYIWALAFAPDGALYVATGQQGKIFKVTGAGRGELYYETGQAHVTALAFDREGRLLAGSEPNGILYRITGTPARGFVLYDANLPEIRAIVPAPDGAIYAAALGGSLARKTSAATSAASSTTMLTAPPTSITVTDAQSGLNAAQARTPPSPTRRHLPSPRPPPRLKSPASSVPRCTKFSPTTPSKPCGPRKTKTFTTWRPTPAARCCFLPTRKAASIAWTRGPIARMTPRWSPRPTNPMPRA